MADYKDYIVRYDIQASTQNAAIGLRELIGLADKLSMPMKTVADSIKQVSSSITQLKQNSNVVFKPTINTGDFQNQLRKMVLDVRAAATEMHTALFEALSGNPMAKTAMQKGINHNLNGTKSLTQLRRDLESYERELDKIYGTRKKNKRGETIRNRDGSMYYAKKGNMHERVAELEGLGKAIRTRISQTKANIAELEKLEKEAAQSSQTTTRTTRSAAIKNPQVAAPANIDAAFLKQWGKLFGNSKSVTLRLNVNATKALQAIADVDAALTNVRNLAKFEIMPVLNNTAFETAKTQLTALSRISGKIAQPFAGLTQQNGGKNVKGGKGAKGGANALIVDVIGNVTSAVPATELVLTPLIGKVTQLQNAVAEALPIKAKITSDSLKESIKGMKRPNLPVNVKLSWEKGAIGKQSQLKGLQEKLPPIKLILDTSAAIEKLEAFIASVKASSPQNIALTATGTTGATTGAAAAGTGTGTVGAQTTRKGGKGSQPLTAKERYDQMQSKSLATYQKQRQDNRFRAAKHSEYDSQQAAWRAQQQAMYNRLFERVPGPDYGWARRAEMQRATELAAMRQDAIAAFSKSTPFEQREEAQRRAGANSSIARHQRQANNLRAQLRNSVIPWVANESQLNTVLQNRKYFRDAITLTGINPMSPNTTTAQMRQYLLGVRDWMSVNNAPVPWQLQDQIRKLTAQQISNAEAAAKAQQQQAAAQRMAASTQSIAHHQRQANALRAQFQNSLAPFNLNKEQMNMLTKYRKFFKQATVTSGITPVAGMSGAEMSTYLKAVAAQMQAANIAVPTTMTKFMQKLENPSTRGGGGGTRYTPIPAQKSFFDRARKWAYPFTGQTSFGVRTPMAVDMAKGMGVMFAIGGAMSAIGGSFSQAMEYQNTMRTTQAILQNGTDSYSQSNFRNMEEIVREVGIKTKFSAPEVANAARFLAMAGFDINDINHSIRPIADLALIGDLDLGETADKMTNIMTTFKIPTEMMRDAANIMTTTFTRSNTDLMMLAESAKYGGGMARLYGSSRENPLENFAETMAIFGVMGNAGVQGSSAGTALRMMYMNLFNPNSKQQAVHERLLKDYKISMYQDEAKTKRRSIADIIKDIANKVPQAEMADLVSKLFRITATQGAAAVLNAAEVDQSQAEQSLAENEAIVKQLTKGNTLSQLAKLIDANVKSIGGDISGTTAEAKQTTIQGLWAQVTSTFTEGIVKAFETRQGDFENMLKGLRDYMARPETVTMLQNLLDMVVEIGKVLADVVALWAKIYSTAPGLIKFWVKWQMIFTQIGSFIAPVVALIGVFNRLGSVIAALTGVGAAGAASLAGGDAAMMAPLLLGAGANGKPLSIQGNMAARAREQLAANTESARAVALTGGNYAAEKKRLDAATKAHYKAVAERYSRIYSPKNMWKRLPRNMWSNVVKGAGAALSWASFTSMFSSLFGGFTKIFTGLMTVLSRAVGLLVNPITLTVGAAVGLGYGLYQLKQRIDGVTDAQIRSRKEAQISISQTVTQLNKQGEWHKTLLTEGMPDPIKVISSAQKEKIVSYERARQDFQNTYGILFKDFTKDASEQSISDVTKGWRQMILTNRQNRLAIGNRWANLTEQGLVRYTEKYLPYQNQVNPTLANSLVASSSTDAAANGLVEALVNRWYMDEGHAKELRDEIMVQALMMEGGNSTAVQKVVAQLIDLKKKVLTKAINPDTQQPYNQTDFITKAQELRKSVVSMWPVSLPASDLTIEKYRQTDDRSVYDAYQTGALNVIDAYIQGLNGTKIAILENQIKLQGKLSEVQDVWFDAVAAVASGYTFFDEFTSKDGKRTADVSFQLNILPNGLIDFSSLEHQIMEKVGAFKLNLQKFSDIAATFYNSLGTILNENELYNLILKQNVNKDIDEATARQYYREHIANNTSNRWYKAGFTEQQYVDFVMDKSNNGYGKSTKFGNTTVRSADERVQMRKTISGDSARAVTKAAKETQEKAEQTAGKGNANAVTPPPKTTSTPRTTTDGDSVATGGNQDVYASHYAKDAARPAVVNININELAHFDRTAIASSAEERDLMAAMEARIADSVYRVFAVAANQASFA